jgi:hypothetical protein
VLIPARAAHCVLGHLNGRCGFRLTCTLPIVTIAMVGGYEQLKEQSMPTMNSHFHVRNVPETTGDRCGCASWMSHWRRHTGATRATCMRLGCSNLAEVGAHVEHDDQRRSPGPWIAALCKECNHPTNTDVMVLDSRSSLVKAQRTAHCGV